MLPYSDVRALQPSNHRQKDSEKAVQYDVVGKTYEQIYHLLAVCQVLHPQRIDDSVTVQLQEKLADKMMKMNRGCAVPECQGGTCRA